MGDYEQQQNRLQKMWDDLMSDEDGNASEFGDIYLSDEYIPGVDETVQSSSDEEERPTKRVRGEPQVGPLSSTKRNHSNQKRAKTQNIKHSQAGPSQNIEHSLAKPSTSCASPIQDNETIEQAIEDIIDQITAADLDSEDDNNSADDIVWRNVDGSSLRNFNFMVNNVGIDPTLYEDFINKNPYDCFKIFITNEIINYMLDQTNIYAEQVLKVKKKPKGHVKQWTATNAEEMETFFGILLCMALMKLPKLWSYWSTNFLYTNNINNIMPRNRFEDLLKM